MPLPALAAIAPYLLAAGGGALAGSALAGSGSSLAGTPGQSKQLPTRNPQQLGIMSNLANLGASGIGGQLDQRSLIPERRLRQGFKSMLDQPFAPSENLSFDPIEQRARQQFQEQTIPSIAQRFTNMGQGAQSTGAFRNALGRAGSDLESQLAALRSQYGLQVASQQNKEQALRQNLLGTLLGGAFQQRGQQSNLLQNLLSLGLQSPYENIYIPRSPGFGEQALSGVSQGLGSLLPLALLGGI